MAEALTNQPDLADWPAILRTIVAMKDLLAFHDRPGRQAVLSALLAHDICQFPPAERQHELERVIAQLPEIVRSTEAGMRRAMVDNARRGL